MKRKLKQMPDGSMFDPLTGEIFELGGREGGTFMYIPYSIKLKNEEWFMGFHEAFQELAKDKELRGEPRAVLDYLFAKLSFENFVAVEQKEIVQILSMDKSNVSKAIKLLVEKKIIEKGPRLGNISSFKINPYYCWRGKVKNLIEAREKHLKIVPENKKNPKSDEAK